MASSLVALAPLSYLPEEYMLVYSMRSLYYKWCRNVVNFRITYIRKYVHNITHQIAFERHFHI